MQECPRCLYSSKDLKIQKLQCNLCDDHDQLLKKYQKKSLLKFLLKVRKAGIKKKYDFIMHIDGSIDSCLLLYVSTFIWNLRPLVIFFDDHWNTEQSLKNISTLIFKSNADLITYSISYSEYQKLNDSFLYAGVIDADLPRKIAIENLLFKTAEKYGIKYIFSDKDFRKGDFPDETNQLDSEYIKAVYKNYTNDELKNFPFVSTSEKVNLFFKGIKKVYPFYFGIDRANLENELKENFNIEIPSENNFANIYEEFFNVILMKQKFGIDNRKQYLSSLIRSDLMTIQNAKELLKFNREFDMMSLGMHRHKIQRLIESRINRFEYKKKKSDYVSTGSYLYSDQIRMIV